MFYIGFTSGARRDAAGHLRAAGEITLGDDSRPFEADLDHWSAADYETSWREAVLRLAGPGAESALVTAYHGAAGASHEVWPMRREGATAFIRGPATVEQVDGELSPRGSEPEWRFPLGQLLAFAVEE
jgi:hypothetical protein